MADQPDESQTPTNNADQAPQEERKPLFSVGEREYDVESAVKKIQSADNHISTLESESKAKDQLIADLQAKLDQSTKLEDALAKMKEGKQQPESNDMTDTTDKTPAVDKDALIAELLQKAQETATNSVKEYHQTELSKTNQKASIDAAKARFGDEYETKLRELGSSLGLNDEAIDSMAKSNPALFKQTFGLNAKANPGVYPSGSQNTGVDLKSPELKDVSKHWSSSDKVGAQLSNEAEISKMIKEANGDFHAVAQKLGVNIKNFAH